MKKYILSLVFLLMVSGFQFAGAENHHKGPVKSGVSGVSHGHLNNIVKHIERGDFVIIF